MTVFVSFLFSFQLVLGIHFAFTPGAEDSIRQIVPEDSQVSRDVLTAEEFVEHYVSLTLILEEAEGDWKLFQERRDAYLSTNGITSDHLLSFVSSKQEKPEYWIDLWKNIYFKLKPPGDETGEIVDSLTPIQ
jgi:hypothetical protein